MRHLRVPDGQTQEVSSGGAAVTHTRELPSVVSLATYLAVVAVGCVASLDDAQCHPLEVRRWVKAVLCRAPQTGRHSNVAALFESLPACSGGAPPVLIVVVRGILTTVGWALFAYHFTRFVICDRHACPRNKATLRFLNLKITIELNGGRSPFVGEDTQASWCVTVHVCRYELRSWVNAGLLDPNNGVNPGAVGAF